MFYGGRAGGHILDNIPRFTAFSFAIAYFPLNEMKVMTMVESFGVGKTETALAWWTTKQRVTGHG